MKTKLLRASSVLFVLLLAAAAGAAQATDVPAGAAPAAASAVPAQPDADAQDDFVETPAPAKSHPAECWECPTLSPSGRNSR